MQHSLRRAGAAPPDAGAVTPPKENQPFFTLQRIPGELAREIGSEDALIIVPYGRGVVQRVEVGQDGDGAFLGSGWQEFADACGVGAGWFVVLRHRGGGVLTVKAFDASCCLRELGTQLGGKNFTLFGAKFSSENPLLSSFPFRNSKNLRPFMNSIFFWHCVKISKKSEVVHLNVMTDECSSG